MRGEEDRQEVAGSVAAPFAVCEALGNLVRNGWAELSEGASTSAASCSSSMTVCLQLSEATHADAADPKWADRHAAPSRCKAHAHHRWLHTVRALCPSSVSQSEDHTFPSLGRPGFSQG